jgi:hypothetical protein
MRGTNEPDRAYHEHAAGTQSWTRVPGTIRNQKW